MRVQPNPRPSRLGPAVFGRGKQRPYKRRESGQALVPVIFVVLILTAVAVTLTATSKQESRAAGSQVRAAQQYFIAHGAVNYVAAMLETATNGGTTPPQIAAAPNTDANGWTQLGDGWYKADIIDTASRVNINAVSVPNAASLEQLPVLSADPDLVAAILDWRDADENVTNLPGGGTGAESDYYQTLNPPYMSKNAPFDSVDELLLVKGFTPDMLYTPVAPTQSSTGAQNLAATLGTSTTLLPLSELLTTYSRELNVSTTGVTRVNILTATASQMQNAGIPANVAQAIVQGRTATTGGATTPTITSIADLTNGTFRGITRQTMQQIGDVITVSTGQYRNGAINLNTASPEALATIPGLSLNGYSALIQARQGGTIFTGMNDVFQVSGLNAADTRALVEYGCTKSSVYLVRVRVRMPGSPQLYAVEAMVELEAPTTGGTSTGAVNQNGQNLPQPKILQFREVPMTPGWSSWVAPPNYNAQAITPTGVQ